MEARDLRTEPPSSESASMIPDVRVPAKSSAELEAKTTRLWGTLLLLGRSRTFELKAEAPLIESAWSVLMAKAKHAVQERRRRRRGAEEAAMAAKSESVAVVVG